MLYETAYVPNMDFDASLQGYDLSAVCSVALLCTQQMCQVSYLVNIL